METPNVNVLITEADLLLKKAEQELQQEERDVNVYMTCQNSRQAISNLLASYLLKAGVELQQPVSIGSLMDQCKSIDKQFAEIDISRILCRQDVDDEEFCLQYEKVRDCLKIAKQIRAASFTEAIA